MSDFAAEARERLPEPGTDPLQHARHTLAAFEARPDDEFAVMATAGVYDRQTGLTWGDLRELARRAESAGE